MAECHTRTHPVWLERHTDEVTSFEWPQGPVCSQHTRLGGWVVGSIHSWPQPLAPGWVSLPWRQNWSHILWQPQRQPSDILTEDKNPNDLRPSSSHLDCKGAKGLDGNIYVNPSPPPHIHTPRGLHSVQQIPQNRPKPGYSHHHLVHGTTVSPLNPSTISRLLLHPPCGSLNVCVHMLKYWPLRWWYLVAGPLGDD